MKIGLPMKLGLGVILLFAVVMAAALSYMPLRYKWISSQLMSNDPALQKKAASSIKSDGVRAVPHLEDWLESGNDRLVIATCRALGEVDQDILKKFDKVLDRLLDGKPSPLTDAAAAVFEQRTNDWMNRYDNDTVRTRNMYCYRLRYHMSWKVRKNAAQALGHMEDPGGIPRLIEATTKEEEANVRQSVVWALGELGDYRGVKPLLDALAFDKDEDVRRLSNDSIYKIKDPRSFDTLILALSDHKHPKARETAAHRLLALENKLAVPALLNTLKNDSDGSVRSSAAFTLGLLKDKRAILPLIAALENDSDARVRSTAASGLDEFKNRRAVLPLIEALTNDIDNSVRSDAASSLGALDDNRAILPLINALEKDTVARVRQSCAISLGYYSDNKSISALIKALDNSTGIAVPTGAAIGLGTIGENSTADALIKALEDHKDNENTTTWIAWALGRTRNPNAIEPLLALLNRSDEVKIEAVRALGNFDDPRIILPLINVLEKSDRYFYLTTLAAIPLARFEHPKIDPALKEIGNALEYGNHGAAAALAWRFGGEYITNVWFFSGMYEHHQATSLGKIAQARWGDVDSIEVAIEHAAYDTYDRFSADVFSLMPDGFPDYDINTNYKKRNEQIKPIKKWYKKHKTRLAWDKEKRRYYLKPSAQKKSQ